VLGSAAIPDPPAAPDILIDLALLPERSLIHPLRLHLRDARDHSPLVGVGVHAVTLTRAADGNFGMQILNFGAPQNPPADRDLELPISPCTLNFHKEGFVARVVDVDPTRPGAPTELTIELSPPAGSLVLHLTDAGGQPIAGAFARVYALDGDAREPCGVDASSDEHGVLDLGGLRGGEGLVIVWKEGFAPSSAEFAIDAPTQVLDLELDAGYEVPLEVRLPDGTKAATGNYSVENVGGDPLYDFLRGSSLTWRKLDGARVRLVDGTYRITCRIPGQFEGSTEFVAAPGASVAVKLAPIGH